MTKSGLNRPLRSIFRLTAIALFLSVNCVSSFAREVAVKSNLLYDATATLNIGMEVGVASQWTLDLSGNINAWKFGHRSWRHSMIQPEVRYWLVDNMGGHFLSTNIIVGYYNAGHFDSPLGFVGWHWEYLNEHRFEGWAYGVGVGYGYALMISRHWNLELEATVGYINTNFDRFVVENNTHDGHHVRHYFGPTKLGVNICYVF